MLLFDWLIYAHIVTGTVGLLTLWVPILARKGGAAHKRWGRVFVLALKATGAIAIGISLCTLAAPLETHPFWDDAAKIRAVFGWMMLYLALLTVNLANYGQLCIQNRHNHAANRSMLNLAGQGAMFLAAVNCAVQGFLAGVPLLSAMATIGIAAGILNTRFIMQTAPAAQEWLIQHTRGLVGAGISVYTAFLAFGAVNLLPEVALNPILWATPCTLGIIYLLYHQFRIEAQQAKPPSNQPVSAR